MNTATEEKDDIIFQEFGDAVLVTLHRPKEKNAVSLQMCLVFTSILEDFEKTKSLVILKSDVPKVFSSGGDVICAAEQAKKKNKSVSYYPRYGYTMINIVSTLKIPLVSLNNGLTMGAGVGVCIYSKYFVCTENSDLSMPECRIGHFPDVCTSYLFSRLKNHLGYYLALTGTRIKGYDIVCAGIATHFCPSVQLPKLENALLEKPLEVDSIISSFATTPKNVEFSLAPHLDKIDRIFSADTVERIIERLEEDGSRWSQQTITLMGHMCPLSLKVTFRHLNYARKSTLESCLQKEYVLANTTFGGTNFIEGVRARLKDQDHKPMWVPRALKEVTPQMVEHLYRVKPHMGPLNIRPVLK